MDLPFFFLVLTLLVIGLIMLFSLQLCLCLLQLWKQLLLYHPSGGICRRRDFYYGGDLLL